MAFLIHQSVQFTQLAPTLHPVIESLSIKLVVDGSSCFTVTNVYIPPVSSCPRNVDLSLDVFTLDDTDLLVGDFNAHHGLWHSALAPDSRGNSLAQEIEDSDFVVLNESAATRVAGRKPSSPDISLVRRNWGDCCSWKVETALGSEHLPNIIALFTEPEMIPSQKRTFINFRKADWPRFTALTESEFSKAGTVTDVNTAYKLALACIHKAAAATIPAGRIPLIRPAFPA